jgi:transcriptional repressor NrdR
MRARMVVKRDGRREEFVRDKLWASVTKACAKRPLPLGSIEKVLEEIESDLSESGRAEITSKDIGELVMDRLKGMDRVAYIRYASVYRDFRDIESFKQEIEALIENREPDDSVPKNQLSMLEDETPPIRRRRRRGRRPKRPQANPA